MHGEITLNRVDKPSIPSVSDWDFHLTCLDADAMHEATKHLASTTEHDAVGVVSGPKMKRARLA